MTVIRTSSLDSQNELKRELEKLTKHFKKLHSRDLVPSPGTRWMNYALNSGNSRVIEACKGYMGQDDRVIIDKVNSELTELGDKPHRYNYNETLDKFLPDWYIKNFLQNFLNATSWESVSDRVKKVCYKGYPNRTLPVWDRISI